MIWYFLRPILTVASDTEKLVTYMVIDDHGYDGKHINGIIDLTDNGIGVRQSFL